MKVLAIVAATIGLALAAATAPPTVPSPFPAATPGPRVDVKRDSLYLPMRDGVRLAIELIRASNAPAGARVPAIVRFTRYGRTGGTDGVSPTDAFWALRNYAVVSVDQRGTGASFGRVRYGKAELGDMRAVLDWVVAQPWSNGRVGAIGTSYEGTTAELLAATGHPAVRAVAPLYSDYDYYDLFRPGGVFNEGLAVGFSQITAGMDAGGVAVAVETDPGRAQLQAALAEHRANADLAVALRSDEFDDDVPTGDLGGSSRDLGPVGSREALERARVPELLVTSWYDAAVAQGALQRYADVAVPQRVVIGATNHGGHRLADPFRAPAPNPDGTLGQQYRLAAAFFQPFLIDGTGASPPNEISYFTTGENVWRTTATWPPVGMARRSWFLAHDARLTTAPDRATAKLSLDVVTTGAHNRWYSQMTGEDVSLTEIAQGVGGAPSFTTEPLTTAIEITGTPVLHLTMSASIADPSLFAYLLAVAPDGTTTDLTQGELRLVNRKLDGSSIALHSFLRRDAERVRRDAAMDVQLALLPLSTTVPKGYRLRLALAAGERPAFVTGGAYVASVDGRSRLELPIRERPDLNPSK